MREEDLNLRALRSLVLGSAAMAMLLFIPAGTLRYWQAWLLMAVFIGAPAAITVYLARHNPDLLERRLKVGPKAETEPAQKIIVGLVLAGFIALLVVPAFDHRYGWTAVPPVLSFVGAALVALGFLVVFVVLMENTYGASTIQVVEGQTVVSTGPYALVRHPMYAGALLLLAGIPPALGSWLGWAVNLLLVPALVWRLVDEEAFLRRNLSGYSEYCQRVRYRLVPSIW